MLNENIRAIRKSKGLSQEELAVKINVVRQTVSKWEKGLSVPDSDLLIALSEALETPVSVLVGERVAEEKADELKAICEKLEVINLQLALNRESKRKRTRGLFIALLIAVIAVFLVLLVVDSPYLNWDYSDPERAVVGVALHAFEWIFVRLAPFALVGAVVGIILTRKK